MCILHTSHLLFITIQIKIEKILFSLYTNKETKTQSADATFLKQVSDSRVRTHTFDFKSVSPTHYCILWCLAYSFQSPTATILSKTCLGNNKATITIISVGYVSLKAKLSKDYCHIKEMSYI